MKNVIKFAIATLTVFSLALVISVLQRPSQPVLSSTLMGNDYMSTTTIRGGMNYVVLKAGPGSLARVTITGAGLSSGPIELYDATTTKADQRAKTKATTTLVSFPATATVGTYDFDLVFNDGLLLSFTGSASTVPSGAGTTTIMWR